MRCGRKSLNLLRLYVHINNARWLFSLSRNQAGLVAWMRHIQISNDCKSQTQLLDRDYRMVDA